MKTVYSVISLSFLIILLLVTPVVSLDSDWVEYGKSVVGNISIYNKVDIKQSTKDTVQVSTIVVFSDKGREEHIQEMRNNGRSTEGYDKLSHTLFLHEIHCKDKRFRLLSFVNYDTDGKTFYSGSPDIPDWKYIVLNSTIDYLRKEVCVSSFLDDWMEYGRSRDGNVLLYNEVSIKHITYYILQIQGKYVFSDKGRKEYIKYKSENGRMTKGFDKLSHQLTLVEIDCLQEKFQVLSITEYDTNGKILNIDSFDETNWSYIPPKTFTDTLRKKVCVPRRSY